MNDKCDDDGDIGRCGLRKRFTVSGEAFLSDIWGERFSVAEGAGWCLSGSADAIFVS